MTDYGLPVLNEHARLSHGIDVALREHDHARAARFARQMADIAGEVAAKHKRICETRISPRQGFWCAWFELDGQSWGSAGFHAGYDYLTGKGYLRGFCEAEEALRLCQQAQAEQWDGDWEDRGEIIRRHEAQVATLWEILRQAPGILQSALCKQHPEIEPLTLYYAEKRGDIRREKNGRTYMLSLSRL
jgi:hypothetical protein